MRMRKRPNLAPRMEKCAELMINEPETMRGHWRELMPDCAELHIELGCGKGRFTAGTAAAAPDVELIAIEKVPDAMIIAMERVKNQELKMSASSAPTLPACAKCSRRRTECAAYI